VIKCGIIGAIMEYEKRLTILVSVMLIITVLNLFISYAPSQQIIQKPQPARVQVSDVDAPTTGLKNAPVTIIEFSDFECSYCEKFYTQTLPLIQKNYITTGKLRFVYRDFPIAFHQYAYKAAEAAKCAQEQGKFWEYHDLLFNNQNSLDNSSFIQFAQELRLNETAFNDCLDSGRMNARVQNDINDGSKYGITGTPTFYINGIELAGAQPYSVFEKIIDGELNKSP
jgi:protein-disulfide isomerase